MFHRGKDQTAQRLARIDSVVVIGLGRFGRALALELMSSGTEVLGIDAREQIVQEMSSHLTHCARADSTNEDAMRQLAVQEFDRAVVAIGTDIESSLLTASLLMNLGISNIWANTISQAHGRILDQLGIAHVIYPSTTWDVESRIWSRAGCSTSSSSSPTSRWSRMSPRGSCSVSRSRRPACGASTG